MKELKEWLNKHFISYSVTDQPDTIIINDELYGIAYPKEIPVLGIPTPRFFSMDFKFIGQTKADKLKIRYYVYKFGYNWFYLEVGQEENVKLNRLLYIGKADVSSVPFVGVHSQYELMNGTGRYCDWVEKASFLGCKELGICEYQTLAGALKFQNECQKYEIRPIFGMTISVFRTSNDFNYKVKAYVKDECGWENLLSINKILNCGNNRYIEEKDLLLYTKGLIIIYDTKDCDYDKIIIPLFDYYQLDTVSYKKESRDKWYLLNLSKFVNSRLKPIAIWDAYYLEQDYAIVRKHLTEINGTSYYSSDNQWFKTIDEYKEELGQIISKDRFDDLFDTAIGNLQDVVSQCQFIIPIKDRHLPHYKMTEDEKKIYKTNEDMLWGLIEKGLDIRKDVFDFSDEVIYERIEREVKVLKIGNVIDYFLITYDICKWCRENNILTGIARGSAGGSLVAYLLQIINVNPLKYDLIFERFLNEGRVKKSLPDIDSDFPGLDRDKVKAYMEQRYGVNQVCSVGTYSALQPRASIRDLSKRYGIPFSISNYITSFFNVKTKTMEDVFALIVSTPVLQKFFREHPEILNEMFVMLEAPKAQSVHACATMVFPDDKDMYQWIPMRKQGDLFVSEWEGGEMDEAGFLKEDILGIKELDKIQGILNLIKENYGTSIDIYNLPLDDKKVYYYFSQGWNGDVFHFGSAGLTGYLKEMQPENINHLISAIALYRPGAMENGFHTQYIKRKNGDEKATYRVGAKSILEETYGIFCFQEDVMELCKHLGGFNLVEADDIRKALGKKIPEKLQSFGERFIKNYSEQYNVSIEYATSYWGEIVKASSYLFNKSHATGYALMGYACEWLKVHYPLEFWTIALNMADETKIPMYISEIYKTTKSSLHEVDINKSETYVKSDVETKELYWSLSSIKGLGESASVQLQENKSKFGQYFSFDEFLDRHSYKGSSVNKTVVERLILSGAFDELENIKYPIERKALIDRYRDSRKVKIGENDFIIDSDKINKDWWWTLWQKRYSGLAFFEYEQLIDEYMEVSHNRQYSYKSFDEISSLTDKGIASFSFTTGGYVCDVVEKSNKKGKYCKIQIEQNYVIKTLLVQADYYVPLASYLRDTKKSLLLFNGTMFYDKYLDEYFMVLKPDSVLKTLS